MYKSKHQIDKHVLGILGSIRDEKERQSKGYQIAKLYLEIKEYDAAKKYLDGFLMQRVNFAPAHRLMGQVLEAQGLAEKAVESYKRALQLDDKQKDVLVKICELYCQLDVDPEKATYWAERVDKVYPNHQVSFQLREHALQNLKGDLRGNHDELENLIAAELLKRPGDAGLRAKMTRLFLDTERVNEAYTHVLEMEQRVLFTQSQEWNQAILDVLQEYKRESGKKINGMYHQTLLSALNNLAAITLEQPKVTPATEVLHQFDQTLYSVCQHQGLGGDSWNVFLREMKAQFFFHVASLLLKKAQQNRLQWREAVDLASACYLCSSTFKPPSKTASWYATAQERERPLLDYWYQIACHRCSQTGHMIRHLCGVNGAQWMERIQEEYCTDQGKDKLFSVLFTQPQMKSCHSTSFLIKNTDFTIIAPELPRKQQLREYDAVSYGLFAESLQNVVWIALQYYSGTEKTQPDYKVPLFETLQHGVLNLDSATPETLCQLDIQAFLYAAVYVSRAKVCDVRRHTLSEPGEPSLLPPGLCLPLVSDDQTQWWDTVCKIWDSSKKDHLGKLRLTLQRGLEIVRVVGNHGMDISLVAHLARTFQERIEEAKEQSSNVLDFANEIASLQARAQAYWRVVVEMAEAQLRGTCIRPPKKRMFELEESRDDELVLYLQEGRYFLACVAMAEGRNEEALQALDNVNTAEAAYFQGQLYKTLANEELGTQMLDQTSGDERNKQIALLTKSRDKFYQTLDRLRGDKAHPLNADLADEIDDVESRLGRLDNDCVPRDISIHEEEDLSCAPMEVNSRSFRKPHLVASTPRRNLSVDISRLGQSKAMGASHLHSSTAVGSPRTRPSPERLEAQLRQFTHTQDTVVMTLLEELKERRKITQQTQEKILSLEMEKGSLQQEVSQLKNNLNMAERERDNALQRIEFMKEETIKIDDEKQRLSVKEMAAEEAKLKADEKLRETEREQNKLEYENKRVRDEMDRLKKHQEKLDGERKALDDRTQRLEHDRMKFEEEKRVEFEREKERRKKEDEERTAREQAQRQQAVNVAQQQQQQQQHPRPDLYNPGYRAYQPGYDLFAAAQYGYQGQQYQHPLMAGLQQGYRFPHAGMAGQTQPRPQTAGVGDFPQAGYQEEEYYYEDEDDDEENGHHANGAVIPPQAGRAYVLPGQQPVIPQIYPNQQPTTITATAARVTTTGEMPGPGFFSSPDKPVTAAPTVIQPVIPGTGSPSLVSGQPIVNITPGNSTLAALLSTGAMASQAQGAALYSMKPGPNKYQIPLTATVTPSQQAFAASTMTTAVTTSAPTTPFSFAFNKSPAPASTSTPAKGAAASSGAAGAEEDGEHNQSAGNDSYQEPDFEPLVSLPEVDVVTGEESETVLVECRAKLYRYVDNQWKERGIGQIKILHNPDSRKVRVLMRREQIFKICANHYISADMEVKGREGGKEKNVLTWRAQDHSDEHPRLEQFCCRFKTEEVAQEFKEGFEKGRELARKADCQSSDQKPAGKSTADGTDATKSTDTTTAIVTVVTSTDNQTVSAKSTDTTTAIVTVTPTTDQSDSAKSTDTQKSGFGNKFKPAEGTWTCSGCYCQNDSAVIQCPACETAKPGHEKEVEEKQAQKSSGALAKFGAAGTGGGFGSSGGSIFGAAATLSTGGSGLTPSGSFTFGSTASFGGMGSKTGSTSSISSIGSFTFGQKPVATDPNVAAPSGPVKFTFGPVSTAVGVASTTTTSSTSSTPSNLVTSLPKPTATVSDNTGPNKPAFGGFTFSQKPDVKEDRPKEDQPSGKDDPAKKPEAKPSPFAAFSFGQTSTVAPTTSPFAQKSDANTETSSAKPLFGSGGSAGGLSFANLAQDSNNKEALTKKSDFPGFTGAGKPLFGGTPARSPEKAKGEALGAEEEYEPDVDFKPVVELPEVVDLKTGEEDETVLFCARSKLYRFDLNVKQWKERGIGELKLLRHQVTHKYRCLMRREQVLKLCANHLLVKDMTLTPLESSEKTYRWMATDFSEEESKQEMFAAKFKSQEIADDFRDEFLKCIQALNEAPIPTMVSEETVSIQDPQRPTPDIVSSTQSLSEAFKLKAGQWECKACYCRNPSDALKCPACQAVQPGCEDQVTKSSPASSIIFGSTVTTPNKGFSFGPAPTTATTSSPFGQQQATSTTSVTGTPVFGGFGANQASSGTQPFGFGSSNQVSSTTDDAAATKSFAFGTSAFNFSLITPVKSTPTADGTKPKTPIKSPLKSPLKSPGGGDEYYVDDDGAHIHFEPIVQLPDDYEHKTGEEDEETLYSHRAKLYRFADNQWKERGLGDIKILKHQQSGRVRILMRREQVLKICLNHRLLADLELKPMANAQGKAWVWHADDYSEGELRHEQLAIRFKTEDVANEFKSVFDDAKQGKEVTPIKVMDKKPEGQSKVEEKSKTEVTCSKEPESTGIKPRTLLDSFNFTSPKPAQTSSSPSTSFKFGEAKFNFGQASFGSPSTTAASGFSAPKSAAEIKVEVSSTTSTRVVTSPTKPNLTAKNSLLANLLSSGEAEGKESPDSTTGSEDDVIYLGEKQPSPDQAQRANQYMLPKSFYFHENPDFPICHGCLGCDSENFDFDLIGKSETEDDVIFLYEETASPSKQHLVDKFQLPPNFYNYEHKEGCTGCPGCQGNAEDNEEEAIIQAAVSCLTGDRGNIHYGKQLHSNLTPDEEIVQAAQAFVTGDRGILAYQDNKDNIVASTAAITGDKGNPYYAKELKEADSTTKTTETSSVFGSFSQPGNGFSTKPSESSGVFGSFSQAGGFDFAALAQQSPDSGAAFGKKKDDSGGFQWAGAGASVFSPGKGAVGGDDHDGMVEQGPDVHFEPIVSLPEVEVRTGEEDEEAIYAQRSKLYRFDNNQWKERGVGEIKILKHKTTLKYRLLMRREQVFKICCNHQLSPGMVLAPMQTSESAWCWNALDYTEAGGSNEQFALRFKNNTLAQEFYDTFVKCQQDLQDQQESESTVTSSSDQARETDKKEDMNGNQPDSTTVIGAEAKGPETGPGEDDDDYEDEDRDVMFTKRVTMNYLDDSGEAQSQGMGELQVYLDDDVYGYRIRMENDDAAMVCNHIICRKHLLQKSEKKKFAEWTAKDFSTDEPVKRTFKVTFSSSNAVKEFVGVFRQGVQMAVESEIEEVSDQASITGELFVPPVVSQGGDGH